MLYTPGSVEATPGESLPNGFTRGQILATLTRRVQELILLPTEKCNLRCTYCYEDFAIGRMSEATQVAIERFIDRRVPELVELRLNWFGGEPLVAKAVVLRLAQHAKKVCDQHGVVLKGGMTTNGYLLDAELLDRLLDNDHDFFQITLDGWEESHDAVRRFANGRGTFQRIWSNLLAMSQQSRPFDCLLRIHVRRENIDTLATLVTQLAAAFGADPRFRLDFEHVRDLGGAGGATVRAPVSLDELRLIETEMRAIYDAARPVEDHRGASEDASIQLVEQLNLTKAHGESAGSQRAEDLAAGGNYICYAAKANSLLVRADGRIGKCTVALNDPRNDIGRLAEDGSVVIDNDKLRPWISGLGTLEVATLGCPLSRLTP